MRSPTTITNIIRAELLRKGTIISKRIMSRRLSQEFGLISSKPARKSRLTERMKSKRVAFARKYASWSLEEWANVIFSDESTVQLFSPKTTPCLEAGRETIQRLLTCCNCNCCKCETPPKSNSMGGYVSKKEQLDCIFYLIACR